MKDWEDGGKEGRTGRREGRSEGLGGWREGWREGGQDGKDGGKSGGDSPQDPSALGTCPERQPQLAPLSDTTQSMALPHSPRTAQRPPQDMPESTNHSGPHISATNQKRPNSWMLRLRFRAPHPHPPSSSTHTNTQYTHA